MYIYIYVNKFQVVQVHQNTVDSYLEGIILATIDSSATDQASAEIMQKADQINELAYEIEERYFCS